MAQLWAKLIDKIICDLQLEPCSHEPYLYYTKNYNNTGKTVLFLRQVDDFAVSCQDRELATTIINQINDQMTIDEVKELGMITRFNGIDVLQTCDYVKLYNQTYIEKILEQHAWIHQGDEIPNAKFSIPMHSESMYTRKLETTDLPTVEEINGLEHEYGFGYQQAIGKLIYALVTCRPDISFPVIKLSQYAT